MSSGQAANRPQGVVVDELDLGTRPHILFQVFGEASDPRMIPVAALIDGQLKAINLTPQSWERFDELYLRSDKSYTLFSDGRQRGVVRVKRGMWESTGEPLYSLPGCQALMPLASVKLEANIPADFTLEYLVSSAPLGHDRAVRRMTPAEVARLAKQVGAAAGRSAGIDEKLLDSLDLRAVAIQTGTGAEPTLVASFIDPGAANRTGADARTTHLFAIAERDSSGTYRAAYSHRVNGPLAAAMFRRYFDHLDLTGDGLDEIVVEGWEFGGDSYLAILSYVNGVWKEIFRARANWCLD
ncbi:MAG TPA: hypothetical protein VJ803_10005 [Gemmatimonadaceae bacterium]|nr:hypothetical protein [Gemmatimonadaceae bacterium]